MSLIRCDAITNSEALSSDVTLEAHKIRRRHRFVLLRILCATLEYALQVWTGRLGCLIQASAA